MKESIFLLFTQNQLKNDFFYGIIAMQIYLKRVIILKKTLKSFLAVLLSVLMLFATCSVASASDVQTSESGISALSSAATYTAQYKGGLVGFLNKIVNGICNAVFSVLGFILPGTSRVIDRKDYVSENFYGGTEEFLDSPAENARWNLGYGSESIIPDNFGERSYHMAGYDLNKNATEALDDLKVRAVAISDGTDRGITILANIDCIGIANSDVKRIRAALADYAQEKNIVSINISSSHTHSGIDSQGIWAEQPKTAFNNLFSALSFGLKAPINGVDEEFMQTIITRTESAVKEAVESMTAGSLTYAAKDGSTYIYDRSEPRVIMKDIVRFVFTPDDANVKPTMIANFGCHPEVVGYTSDKISADFVPYMEEVINAHGYNFLFIQSAIGNSTENRGDCVDGLDIDRHETVIRFGNEVGYFLLGMTETEEYCKENIVDWDRENSTIKALGDNASWYTAWYENWEPAEETEIAPLLNVRIQEFIIKVENGILQGMGKLSLANNIMLRDGLDIYTVTEIGYMELGTDIMVMLSPGETYPELVCGGADMDEFSYAPLRETYADKTVLDFDLMNDAIGYIIPDNQYTYCTIMKEDDGKMTFDNAWGMTSMGEHTASQLISNFNSIVDSVK